MQSHRRVTLRCIVADLVGLDDQVRADVIALRAMLAKRVDNEVRDSDLGRFVRAIPHLSQLEHPLVRHFSAIFEDDGPEILRESISAVRDREWLKIKTGQWRGAATRVEAHDQSTVWLCAGGLRRKGDSDDFYQRFEALCTPDSNSAAPNDEDSELFRVEAKMMRLDAWAAQSLYSVLVLVANASETGVAGPMTVFGIDGADAIATVTASIESVDVENDVLTELILEVEPLHSGSGGFVDRLTDIAAAAFNEDWSLWRAAPIGGANGMSYATFLSMDQLSAARAARDAGRLEPPWKPGFIKIGTFAHYAARDGLTAATIEGHPVEALCGYWFVPMHDHEELSVCPICEGAVEGLEP